VQYQLRDLSATRSFAWNVLFSAEDNLPALLQVKLAARDVTLLELDLPLGIAPAHFDLNQIHSIIQSRFQDDTIAATALQHGMTSAQTVDYTYEGTSIPRAFWHVFTWSHLSPILYVQPLSTPTAVHARPVGASGYTFARSPSDPDLPPAPGSRDSQNPYQAKAVTVPYSPSAARSGIPSSAQVGYGVTVLPLQSSTPTGAVPRSPSQVQLNLSASALSAHANRDSTASTASFATLKPDAVSAGSSLTQRAPVSPGSAKRGSAIDAYVASLASAPPLSPAALNSSPRSTANATSATGTPSRSMLTHSASFSSLQGRMMRSVSISSLAGAITATAPSPTAAAANSTPLVAPVAVLAPVQTASSTSRTRNPPVQNAVASIAAAPSPSSSVAASGIAAAVAGSVVKKSSSIVGTTPSGKPVHQAVALYDYSKPGDITHTSFSAGDTVLVSRKDHALWWFGKATRPGISFIAIRIVA